MPKASAPVQLDESARLDRLEAWIEHLEGEVEEVRQEVAELRELVSPRRRPTLTLVTTSV